MQRVFSIHVRIVSAVAGHKPGDLVDVNPILGATWIKTGLAVPAILEPSGGETFAFKPGDEVEVHPDVAADGSPAVSP